MRKHLRFIGLAAAVAAATSCGDVVRQGRSPVLLTVSALGDTQGRSPINSDVDSGLNDEGQAVLQTSMKDTLIAPTSNNLVTINRYHVQFRRADGRNVEGVDVPYSFDGAVTASVTPGQTTTVFVDIVRHAAKHEAPLVQIASGGTVVTAITTVTFYGQDAVGNEIAASGTISVNFGNFQ